MTRQTVLVIEDNEKNMKLVRLLLQLGNYRILEAENAEDGIDIARKHHPALILMDIQLPGMDGLQATQIIKSDKATADIPVVALTSYAMDGDETHALNAGCDGYLTKPIDTDKFLDIIGTYISPGEGAAAASDSDKEYNSVKVMIVDDDAKNVKLMCGLLSKDHYELLTAKDGSEALALVKQNPPDLILLDVMMPGMNGYEVTRRLKANPDTQAIPIILVTALGSPDDRVQGLEAGAEEFLTKPVNPVEIEARIQSMLKLKRYRDQLTIRSHSERELRSDGIEPQNDKGPSGKQHILIVEDNLKDIKLLKSHLTSTEYQIKVVSNGSDAIKAINRRNFDLILLDILLPGMDGFEICKRIKQMDGKKDTQVVLITCLSDLENRIKGVELGADDYLVKPIEPRELQARVKVLLKKKSYLDSLHAHYEKALNSALLDGMTNLYNHTYFKRFLELEIKRSQRQGHSTSLLMIDIDNFKTINDNHGHMAGDEIIRSLAALIKSSIREIDVAARYGGEEFAVVLPYGASDALQTVGERIRSLIEAQPFVIPGNLDPLKITVSIGGAIYPAAADTAEALIEAADQMLYTAKRKGKNRVHIFEATAVEAPNGASTGGVSAVG